MFHDQSKHTNAHCHFIKEYVAKMDFQLKHTKLQDQVADISQSLLTLRDYGSYEPYSELPIKFLGVVEIKLDLAFKLNIEKFDFIVTKVIGDFL